MKVIDAREYIAERPWGARDVATIDNVSVRLHWTNQPYIWHVNDGAEVFVVVDGVVDMHHRKNGEERVTRLEPGHIFCAEAGDEHYAAPIGDARIVVIERSGSI